MHRSGRISPRAQDCNPANENAMPVPVMPAVLRRQATPAAVNLPLRADLKVCRNISFRPTDKRAEVVPNFRDD